MRKRLFWLVAVVIGMISTIPFLPIPTAVAEEDCMAYLLSACLAQQPSVCADNCIWYTECRCADVCPSGPTCQDCLIIFADNCMEACCHGEPMVGDPKECPSDDEIEFTPLP